METHDADHAMDGEKAMTGAIQYERLSIGFGCSSRATVDDIIGLITEAVDPIPAGTMIATLDRRASIGGVVAAKLGLRLMLFPSVTLAEIEGITARSERALAETRTANVAEASALAALGSAARLVVTQIKGHRCTCAIAALHKEVQP